MEVLEDQGEMFDTLMDLRDDMEAANTKLHGLNALIAQAATASDRWADDTCGFSRKVVESLCVNDIPGAVS
ncbi:hypothetical protein Tco_0770282 [Tanacetum coccineum]|uniref:Uncharacterized protein n=1 Tax=Tanacetum coccineum TaxID=301880 RepID=A0ABQ4ZEE9_9ASTR